MSYDQHSLSSSSNRIDCDYPPYSRLFILCDKSLIEDDLRNAFSPFGCIQDVWVVRDHANNNQSKGMAYLKFSKASSAAQAIEAMDGQILGDHQKSLKCMIAQSKNSTRRSNCIDEYDRARLFVVCPRDYTEEDLKEKFVEFGSIDYCQIVKDHTTKKSKGLGYVKFNKASAAAIALENCDASFRAVLAEPKSTKLPQSYGANSETTNSSNLANLSIIDYLPSILRNAYLDNESKPVEASAIAQKTIENLMLDSVKANGNRGSTKNGLRLFVIVSTKVTQEQLHRLFDIIPGMLSCKIKLNRQTGGSKGFGYVTYCSLAMAAYAREKLNGIEYPIGNKLIVKYAEDPPTFCKKSDGNARSVEKSNINDSQSIAESTSLHSVNSKEKQYCVKHRHDDDDDEDDNDDDEVMNDQLNGKNTYRKRLKITPES
ncbi:RNA-binding protein 45 [Trichoplax sp. H2]|nr:RNA-binding protein 45 [Trichoplax sp. H2]|eukprot:RDD42608.1 RNA-binding protein 45 [Trichoplax sp. H2]